MNAPLLQLDWADLATGGALVFIAGMISVLMRLQLERRLAIATVRTVVQLLLIGQVLKAVFSIDHPLPLLGIITIMIGVSGRAALKRTSRGFSGAYPRAFFSLLLTGLLTTATVTQLIIEVRPWYQPRYVIPLLGMVLGNSLTGISLCLDHLLEVLDERRELIEAELAMGATRWEAAQLPLSQAVRKGMIPIINSMTIVGLVSLPGMMTGQILAGIDPLEAVKYQMVVMFMLAASTSLGCILVAYLSYRRLFSKRHQLRADHILRQA